ARHARRVRRVPVRRTMARGAGRFGDRAGPGQLGPRRTRAPHAGPRGQGLGRRRRGARPPAGRRHRSDRYPERPGMVAERWWKGDLMAGNSRRRGAVRKGGTKKGQVVGSGGKRRRGLEGRGATPPAEMRTKHPAARRAAAAKKAAAARTGARGPAGRPAGRKQDDGPELVLGRNPVVECLRAGVPATALYVAVGAENDERLTEAVQIAADTGISILE